MVNRRAALTLLALAGAGAASVSEGKADDKVKGLVGELFAALNARGERWEVHVDEKVGLIALSRRR